MGAGVLLFVIAILVVVMVHESGHFLMAKLFGFKATQFFIGFGPTLWSTRSGETEYGVKAIPAGGFVKIVGMNPYERVAPEDRPRSYPNKPAWQRALLLVAGSATHWLMAFVILMVTSMTIGFPTGRATNEMAEVRAGTPAAEAGLRPGDRIVAVGGEPTSSWVAIRDYIQDRGGEKASFTVARDGERRTVTVELGRALLDARGRVVDYARPGERLRRPGPGEQVLDPFFGIAPEQQFATRGPLPAAGEAASLTWDLTVRSALGIGQVFGQAFDGTLWEALTDEGERRVDEGPIGLVGAGRIAGASVARGQYLNLIGLIVGFTVFVGLMNLLPLPPLDGGHLAVVAYEAATGRRVDVRKLIPIAAAVISFFVLYFLAVLYLDIARPFEVPF